MRVWVHGVTGRMGCELRQMLAGHKDCEFVGGSSRGTSIAKLREGVVTADVVIDFSSPEAHDVLWDVRDVLPSLLICTTGLKSAQLTRWSEHAGSVLVAPNTSYGVLVTGFLAAKAAGFLAADYDIEVLEVHHSAKKDAPSGTALHLARGVAEAASEHHNVVTDRTSSRCEHEVGVAVLRGGGVFGEHEIRFLGQHDEVVISHKAYSRALFAQGALKLAGWLLKQNENRLYDLKDILL